MFKLSKVPPLVSGTGSISTTICSSLVSDETSLISTEGVSGTSASVTDVIFEMTLYPLVVIASIINLNTFPLSPATKLATVLNFVGLKLRDVSTSVVRFPPIPSSLQSLNPQRGHELIT